MNKFNIAIIALAASTLAGQAFATDCANGAPHSAWPECKLPVTTVPATQTQSQTGTLTGTQTQNGTVKSANTNLNANSVKSNVANTVKSSNTNLTSANANTGPIKVSTGSVKTNATGGTSSAVGVGGTSTANGTVDANLTGVAAQAGANAGANAGAEAGKNAGANAGAGAGSNNETVQNVSVQGAQPGSGSTYNSSSRVVIHPAMIPAAATTLNPQGNLLAVQTSCSMIVNVQPVPVYATSQGFWGGTEQVQNGNNYLINPVYDERGAVVPFLYVEQADRSTMVIGNQLIVGMSITNQSIAVSGALGLIKSSGAGGQVGGGVSSSLQQMGDRVIAVPCLFAVLPAQAPEVVVIEKEVEVEVLVERKPKDQ